MENTIPKKDLQILEKQVSPLIARAGSYTLETAQDVENASVFLKELHEAEKNIEAKRKEFVNPLRQSMNAINATFKEIARPVSEAKDLVKSKIGVWHRAEQERIAREEARRRKIQEAHEKKGHDVNAPVMMERPDTKIGNSMMKKVWNYRIVDENKIPREFLMVDTTKIRKYMYAMKDQAKVEGVEFYQEEQVAVSGR